MIEVRIPDIGAFKDFAVIKSAGGGYPGSTFVPYLDY